MNSTLSIEKLITLMRISDDPEPAQWELYESFGVKALPQLVESISGFKDFGYTCILDLLSSLVIETNFPDEFNVKIESEILTRLPNCVGFDLSSSAEILGKIGGPDSIDALKERYQSHSDPINYLESLTILEALRSLSFFHYFQITKEPYSKKFDSYYLYKDLRFILDELIENNQLVLDVLYWVPTHTGTFTMYSQNSVSDKDPVDYNNMPFSSLLKQGQKQVLCNLPKIDHQENEICFSIQFVSLQEFNFYYQK